MKCKCCKYAKWRAQTVKASDGTTLEPIASGGTFAYSVNNGFTYDGDALPDEFNVDKLLGDTYNISITNDNIAFSRSYRVKLGDTVVASGVINANSTISVSLTIPTDLTSGTVLQIKIHQTYSNHTLYRSRTFGMVNLGTVDYDTSEIVDYFDRFYACWYIVNPCCDFVNELQLCYDGAKERIDGYYNYLMHDFNPKQNTVMDVDYGARKTTGKDYTYPITGDVTTSTPNAGAVSDTDAVKDTTTVTKDTDPFKTLERVKAMQSFKEYFCEQFKDCFTITSGVTW